MTRSDFEAVSKRTLHLSNDAVLDAFKQSARIRAGELPLGLDYFQPASGSSRAELIAADGKTTVSGYRLDRLQDDEALPRGGLLLAEAKRLPF